MPHRRRILAPKLIALSWRDLGISSLERGSFAPRAPDSVRMIGHRGGWIPVVDGMQNLTDVSWPALYVPGLAPTPPSAFLTWRYDGYQHLCFAGRAAEAPAVQVLEYRGLPRPKAESDGYPEWLRGRCKGVGSLLLRELLGQKSEALVTTTLGETNFRYYSQAARAWGHRPAAQWDERTNPFSILVPFIVTAAQLGRDYAIRYDFSWRTLCDSHGNDVGVPRETVVIFPLSQSRGGILVNYDDIVQNFFGFAGNVPPLPDLETRHTGGGGI